MDDALRRMLSSRRAPMPITLEVETAILAVRAMVTPELVGELYAQLRGNFNVARRGGAIPFEEAYPTAAAYGEGVARCEIDALGASIAVLAQRDLASMLEPALVIAARDRFPPGSTMDNARTSVSLPPYMPLDRAELQRHAAFAIAPSTDDRALAVLLGALVHKVIPLAALQSSAHPGLIPALAEALALPAVPPNSLRRVQAAKALGWQATPRADDILDAYRDDPMRMVAATAVVRTLFRDLPTAWSRFAPVIESALAGDATAERQLDALLLQCTNDTPGSRPPEREPLLVEPRLLDLAAQLRRHRVLGVEARACLGSVPIALAREAIARHPIAEPPAAPAVLPARRDYLARYAAGEHAVWDELVAHADAVAQHADLRAEAMAVALALMTRVRRNADVVRATLLSTGARLADEDRAVAPAATSADLPLALAAFWQAVGAIALVPPAGTHDYGITSLQADGVSLLALDPLQLDSAAAVAPQLAKHAAAIAASHVEIVGPLYLALGPDYLNKQNYEGGPPYSVKLPPPTPADALDPTLLGIPARPRLVTYLRRAFRVGGFSLLELAARPPEDLNPNYAVAFANVRGDRDAVCNRLLARLRAGLIRF